MVWDRIQRVGSFLLKLFNLSVFLLLLTLILSISVGIHLILSFNRLNFLLILLTKKSLSVACACLQLGVNGFAEITQLDMSLCQVQIKPEVLGLERFMKCQAMSSCSESSTKRMTQRFEVQLLQLSQEPYSLDKCKWLWNTLDWFSIPNAILEPLCRGQPS